MTRVEDLLEIDSFNFELPRPPTNSTSAQAVDLASKKRSCDFQRLYSFDIQDDDAKAVQTSSPIDSCSLDTSIGDKEISVGLLIDTDAQVIAPSRHTIILKCEALRRVTEFDPYLPFPPSPTPLLVTPQRPAATTAFDAVTGCAACAL